MGPFSASSPSVQASMSSHLQLWPDSLDELNPSPSAPGSLNKALSPAGRHKTASSRKKTSLSRLIRRPAMALRGSVFLGWATPCLPSTPSLRLCSVEALSQSPFQAFPHHLLRLVTSSARLFPSLLVRQLLFPPAPAGLVEPWEDC